MTIRHNCTVVMSILSSVSVGVELWDLIMLFGILWRVTSVSIILYQSYGDKFWIRFKCHLWQLTRFIFVIFPCGESTVLYRLSFVDALTVAQNQYTGKQLIIFTFLSWRCAMCKSVNCHTMSWAWRKTASHRVKLLYRFCSLNVHLCPFRGLNVQVCPFWSLYVHFEA